MVPFRRRRRADPKQLRRASKRGTSPGALALKDAGLTPRELEVLQLVRERHSIAQVGKEMWITGQTVQFHLWMIYRKLEGWRTGSTRSSPMSENG
jgi:DNA-binding CsgD family transcriptional regulator